MFTVQETPDVVAFLKNGSEVHPLVTLKDEYGGVAHIAEDDHCFVLYLQNVENERVHSVTHWFKEAAQALANFMLETAKAKGDYPPTWSMIFKESFSESLRPAWWNRALYWVRNYFDLNKVLR